MTDLENRTTEVPATSFLRKESIEISKLEDVYNKIATHYNLSAEDLIKFREGYETEKNKKSHILKIFSEILISCLENDKILSDNKVDVSLAIQNKKIIKDLTINVLNLLKNYSISDKEIKLQVLGKVIQSIHDSR